MPHGSVNSYTIQTVQNGQIITIEINYDIVTNKITVIDYKEEVVAVAVVTKPIYYPEVLAV